MHGTHARTAATVPARAMTPPMEAAIWEKAPFECVVLFPPVAVAPAVLETERAGVGPVG